ncbi:MULTISPECIES: branched-chain amino acid ABC transporter permease [Streptomyces]|uniref:branched-chain amino acid ABC transporter permease n=1 Tax=Streptomyces TaxID=1883 RepID=UPI00163BB9DE|nr:MULTISPECIES: branched-chain amino acid ABC transporter permease [Streptomyces]MBC2877157.1 branched-chain amino acid ABC transporter permease [Streptomyces sp. TYQ1024]UBI41258.1 branched-chain amino acid ABC transporter permease [Streptomyces mobaraensis]UKW33756.1 branched-chain amino acid ABC transporter permease [Streptomyces sp. TYQ1024]
MSLDRHPTGGRPSATTPAATPPAATTPVPATIPLPPATARLLTGAGALLAIVSTFLAWTWTTAFPGNLTVTGYPGGLQNITLAGAALTLLHVLAGYGIRGLRWLAPSGTTAPTLLLALGTFAATWYTLGAITSDLGGLVNLEPGGFLAGGATLAAALGALALPPARPYPAGVEGMEDVEATDGTDGTADTDGTDNGDGGDGRGAGDGGDGGGGRDGKGGKGSRDGRDDRDHGPGTDRPENTAPANPWHRFRHTLTPGRPPAPTPLPTWADILLIAAAFALGLALFTYGIEAEYGELFVGYLLLAGAGLAAVGRSGLTTRLSALTARHRTITLTAAFVAAAAFPLTLTSDTYTNLATSILIFATVALGLNVVVGLAGLLDLGYVAFLGVGAYTAALVSGSPESAAGVHFPFWAAVLTGIGTSLVFGVLIGAPTLRLRGDYLAIVTLGFGEIFRITMLNLNGKTGPDITNGAMGIPNIPDLAVGGFDFGDTHDLLGTPIGRFGNYYLLMLLATIAVVLVFRRAAASRIGRAWIAIREDETAATAMGINAFRLKLLAFALGAALAGLAGTVQAHVITTATPDQYQFAGTVPPNSAFLLAAVILGGMGTITGPLVGAALLYLIPNKMDFMQDYQLLLFGVALILLMRFRPEGLVADRRKQLEFHDDAAPDTATLTRAEA